MSSPRASRHTLVQKTPRCLKSVPISVRCTNQRLVYQLAYPGTPLPKRPSEAPRTNWRTLVQKNCYLPTKKAECKARHHVSRRRQASEPAAEERTQNTHARKKSRDHATWHARALPIWVSVSYIHTKKDSTYCRVRKKWNMLGVRYAVP